LSPSECYAVPPAAPNHLDNRGRRILAQLTAEALEAGVASIHREAQADLRITRPLGLVIDRSRKNGLGAGTTTPAVACRYDSSGGWATWAAPPAASTE